MNRNHSIWINLRRFHNSIKRHLIEKIKPKIVLDISCGRGGDVGKYKDSHVECFVGLDPNSEAIIEAKKRSKNDRHFHFYVDKISDTDVNKYTREHGQFDMVTCFFAIHYINPENELESAIKNISDALKSGGYFIGTGLKDIKETDNEKLKIKIISDNQYSFIMKDRNDTGIYFTNESIEYFLDLENLKKICLKYNLEFKGIKLFSELYIDKDYHMTEDEKRVSFMNYVFLFEKY